MSSCHCITTLPDEFREIPWTESEVAFIVKYYNTPDIDEIHHLIQQHR